MSFDREAVHAATRGLREATDLLNTFVSVPSLGGSERDRFLELLRITNRAEAHLLEIRTQLVTGAIREDYAPTREVQ